MNVGARLLKASLWLVWNQVKGNAPPNLRQALQDQATTFQQALAAGNVKSNTANGHTTVWFGSSERFSLPDAVEAWVYLVDEYDRAKGELNAGADDAAIEARMESNLRPVKGDTVNWQYLSK